MLLPNLSALSLRTEPVDVRNEGRFAKEGGKMPRASQRPLDHQSFFDSLPEDLKQQVMFFTKGMPCDTMKKLCITNREFAKLCREPGIWKYMSEARGYDREDRVAWYQEATQREPSDDWKQFYIFWCNHRLTDRNIRGACAAVMPMVAPYKHPKYGPIAVWDVSEVTDMNHLFNPLARPLSIEEMFNPVESKFTGDLSEWDVSNVTSMLHMFDGQRAFNSDLSKWDTRNVITMEGMFENAAMFNGDLSAWKVSNVRSMARMFKGAHAFQGRGLLCWDVSNVTNMQAMFEGALAFNGAISSWNVSNVENMRVMFKDASVFDQDLSAWNVGKASSRHGNMFKMFEGARAYAPLQGRQLGGGHLDFDGRWERRPPSGEYGRHGQRVGCQVHSVMTLKPRVRGF